MTSINGDNNALFIHVPKAAGSVMEVSPWLGGAGHRPALDVQQGMHPSRWESFFKFAFVRNPLDRLVSAYFHFVQKPRKAGEFAEYQVCYMQIKEHHARYASGPLEGFPEFIQQFDLEHLQKTINHFRPQVYFVCDQQGSLLLDFLGRVETLDKDWETVCGLAGQPHLPLARRNATVHRPWQDYYTPELRRLAVALYYYDADVLYPELWE